jgi:hypothetical protein
MDVVALFHTPLIEIEFETRQEKEAFINRFCFFGTKCAIRRAKMPESNSGKSKNSTNAAKPIRANFSNQK